MKAHLTLWQTPQASVLIRISPFLGDATGTSLSSNLAPGASSTIALQVFGIGIAIFMNVNSESLLCVSAFEDD